MARWFLVSFIVVCLLCVIQAFPQSADTAAEPTAASKVEAAVNDVIESLQQSLKKIMEDPNLNKFVQDGQKLLQNAASNIQTEAAKIMPKTE